MQCREVAKNPHIVVTDFEADLQTPYTASTLAFLRMRNPLVRYVWIMGADNLASFDRWQRWREIFTMVPIVVVDRPGWRLKALASKAARAFAAARVPEAEAAGLAHRPAAGLDVPHRPAVPRVLDGAAQQGDGAATHPLPKRHMARRALAKRAAKPTMGRADSPRGLERGGSKRLSLQCESPRGTGFARRRAGSSMLVSATARVHPSGLMTKGHSAQYANRT